jgi:hypothetical protein
MGKKIKITENQLQILKENLQKRLITENTRPNLTNFRVRVPVDFEASDRFMGTDRPIYGIRCDDIILEFDLGIYLKSWGIDDIQITEIRGPRNIGIVIEVEAPDDDSSDEYIDHNILVDWSNVEIEDEQDDNCTRSIESVTIVLDDGFFVQRVIINPINDIRSERY